MSDVSQILKPSFCCVAATDYCMLRCKMCNKWSEPLPKPGEAPTLEEWKNFISGFRELVDEGFEMDFGGGEALSMPGILELIKHAKKAGFRTTLASNGYLINKDMALQISQSGLDAISLSLDSYHPQIHDKMRGIKGVHQQVIKAIDNLTQYSPQTKKGLCCIIMNENLDEIIKLVDWADSYPKVDWIYFMVVVQPNYSGPLTDDWKDEYSYLWPKDTAKVIAVLDELIRLKQNGSKVSNRINAYGFVQLCLFKDFIGNIRQDDIRKLWYSQNAELIRKKVDECKTNCHLLLNCCYIEDEPSLYAK
jgi:MoaA/NifB/PqqE/SkfB family radical SAM enzyme